MTTIGPLLPDASPFAWVFVALLPLVLVVIGSVVLFFVIRKAVAAGTLDARTRAPRGAHSPDD